MTDIKSIPLYQQINRTAVPSASILMRTALRESRRSTICSKSSCGRDHLNTDVVSYMSIPHLYDAHYSLVPKSCYPAFMHSQMQMAMSFLVVGMSVLW